MKRSSSQKNEVSTTLQHDKDEILYQSSALKDRLLESRYSDGAASCASENETISQEVGGDMEREIISEDDENGEIYSILNNHNDDSNDVVLSKRRGNSAKSTITSSPSHVTQFEEDIKISLLDETETLTQHPIRRKHESKRSQQAWKPGNEVANIRHQNNRQPIPMDDVLFKKKNNSVGEITMGKVLSDEKPSSRMVNSRISSPLVKKVFFIFYLSFF